MSLEFEVVEEYVEDGKRRFRVRVKNTLIIFNVEASDVEEAIRKAEILASSMDLQEVIDYYKL